MLKRLLTILAVVFLSAFTLIGIFVYLHIYKPSQELYSNFEKSLVQTNKSELLAESKKIILHAPETPRSINWDSSSITNLHPVIQNLNAAYVYFNHEQLTIEFHGGFDHYGYKVSQSESNLWELSRYSDNSSELLATD